MKSHFCLDPSRIFLNHGSFGACPREILRLKHQLQEEMESDPLEFLAPERSLLPRIDTVRKRVAREINVVPGELVFTRGTTDAVNAVVGSLDARPGDQWLVTSHAYNACRNALTYHAARNGAEIVVADIPLFLNDPSQVLESIESAVTPRVRFMLIDHVTSVTAAVLPVAEIVEMAHRNHSSIMIDGAHAPGMLPLDLSQLNADFYAGNHHKWWCGPKASGFLHVREKYQTSIFPSVISHGLNRPFRQTTGFQSNFDWNGTYDPTALLCVPRAIDSIEAMAGIGFDEIRQQCQQRLDFALDLMGERLGDVTPSAPANMRGQMMTVALNDHHALADEATNLQGLLREKHRIEIPVFGLVRESDRDPILCVRVSCAVYNDESDMQHLVDALVETLPVV